MLYPLTFQPIFKQRVWGGRNLERLYNKSLPPKVPVGESWEICDRPSDISVVANGPLAGNDLHWLVEHYRREILGPARLQGGRFPLLIKLLDAQETLSLQVHPPANKAVLLGGEPKTEMWYIAEATPNAELYVGLKQGTTRAAFEQKIRDGSVADCFHRVPVKPGDAMFLPSGRVHAIGAGLVIFEIQQNSDTTYRVFDWNRLGLDGQLRDLHLRESLESIDFNDFEPALTQCAYLGEGSIKRRQLVQDPLFTVEEIQTSAVAAIQLQPRRMQIIACLQGELGVVDGPEKVQLRPGGFCLVPACLDQASVSSVNEATFLRIVAA